MIPSIVPIRNGWPILGGSIATRRSATVAQAQRSLHLCRRGLAALASQRVPISSPRHIDDWLEAQSGNLAAIFRSDDLFGAVRQLTSGHLMADVLDHPCLG